MKIFNAHFHIIDYKYPLVENNGYLPPGFTLDGTHGDLQNSGYAELTTRRKNYLLQTKTLTAIFSAILFVHQIADFFLKISE